MKLKKLQLQGFKSFADRSELVFDRQIASVVGPNGCGKSNIVDAIRWAMGEQSAKGLRGHDMADVIFAGTPARKPSNVAEVSLVFDNQERLAPAPYTDVSEIMVTRRLFRTGESEYLINKVTVRLKDVNDLFLGTGSSAKAYSIVAQGKVDQVVLAKPEDRRFLIEEAAGVAKYKVRKQSAERKMESTKHNLERVHDILLELEKNARSLERQVEKAEKFRELQKELRQIDEKMVTLKISRIDSLANQNDENLQKAQDEYQKTSTSLLEREAGLEAVRLQILNFEKRLSSEMEMLMRRREESTRFEMEAELAIQRIGMLENQIEDRKKDIERLQAKHKDQEQTREELLREREKLEQEKLTKDQEADVRRSKMAEIDTHLLNLRSELDHRQKEVETLRTEAAARRERAELLKQDRVNQELKRAEFESTLEILRTDLKSALESSEKIRTEMDLVQESLRGNEAKLLERRSSLESHGLNLGSLFEQKAKVQNSISEARSGKEALDTLEQHQVGYELNGLEYKNETGESFLLELVQLKPETQELGEKVLFQLGQYFLHNESAQATSRRTSIRTNGSAKRFAKSAFDLISSTTDSRVEDFLASFEWVTSIDLNSNRACFDDSGRVHLPLTDGFSLLQEGEIRRDQSPFSRRAEAESLDRRLQEAQLSLSEIEKQIVDAQSASLTDRENIRGLIDEEKAFRSKLSERNEVLRREEARKTKIETRIEEIDAELRRLDQKIIDIEEQIRAIPNDESIAVSLTELENIALQVKEIESQKTRSESEWVEFRIELGALQERLSRLQERSVQAEMAQNEYNHNEGIYRQDIELWSEENSRLKTKAETCRKEQTGAQEASLELEKSVATVKEDLAKLQTKVDEDELERRALQLSKDELLKKVQELELERQNLKFQVEELSQIVHERYQLSIPEFIQGLQDQTIEGVAQPSEVPFEELEERSKYLRDRIAKFGDVNLVALQEYEEMKKRLEFMSHQKEDLMRTLDSLQSIIDRINKITEFRFRETFRAINHNFQILFPRLFGGGKAYMSLTDENNLLDSGVEIFAEPPGKKIQAMSLLSGGEKAMTSISLLFSLFSYRPSSFCILDEVDAPLDDINTRRYNEIIREMAGLSQFIVITHNKRTMEVAETLFGVTMQEPGVSKLVGVNLQEARSFSGTNAEGVAEALPA